MVLPFVVSGEVRSDEVQWMPVFSEGVRVGIVNGKELVSFFSLIFVETFKLVN